jgi:hypothetical protein
MGNQAYFRGVNMCCAIIALSLIATVLAHKALSRKDRLVTLNIGIEHPHRPGKFVNQLSLNNRNSDKLFEDLEIAWQDALMRMHWEGMSAEGEVRFVSRDEALKFMYQLSMQLKVLDNEPSWARKHRLNLRNLIADANSAINQRVTRAINGAK